MEFELLNVQAVGVSSLIDEAKSKQNVNIKVGLKNYDLTVEKTVVYEFSNDLTITEARDGIGPFALAWMNENYKNEL